MTNLPLNWNQIDTVLLDMDGTLLNLKFDNDFWLQVVPTAYAEMHRITLSESREFLFPRMRSLKGTIDWYCIDFWSDELKIDIAGLKRLHQNEIGLRKGAIEFLVAVKLSGRRQIMLTNAHEMTLDIKMQCTGIAKYFDELISSHQFRIPKENLDFWETVKARLGIDLTRSLFIDDSESVLQAAQRAGVGHLLGVLKPDSSRPESVYDNFFALDSFSDILPS